MALASVASVTSAGFPHALLRQNVTGASTRRDMHGAALNGPGPGIGGRVEINIGPNVQRSGQDRDNRAKRRGRRRPISVLGHRDSNGAVDHDLINDDLIHACGRLLDRSRGSRAARGSHPQS